MAKLINTKISGLIVISSDPEVAIPLSANIPADNDNFEFEYEVDEVADAPKIPVGEMIKWVIENIGTELTIDDLPELLRNLSIAVQKINFNTNGNFYMKVQIGTVDEETWESSWQPIDGLDFKISEVSLEFSREAGSDLKKLPPRRVRA